MAIGAPFAAQLAIKRNALRIVGWGVLLSSIGAVGTAFSMSFRVLLFFRAMTGAGTGPLIALAPALVDDAVAPERRSAALGALFLCLPAGFAAGFLWSTYVAATYGWRLAFLIEGGAMVPFALILICWPRPNDIKRDAASGPVVGFLTGVYRLGQRPPVLLAMVSRALFLGALGGFSFYGSKAAKSIFKLDPSTADIAFGVATLITGSIGTLSGGLALDKIGSSVRSALLLCICSTSLAAIGLSFTYGESTSLWTFFPGLLFGEVFLFSTSAPATAAIMWSAPPELRPAALALSEILNHVIGDVPAPPLLGDFYHLFHNWRWTISACMLLLGVATSFFAFARCSFAFVDGELGSETVISGDEVTYTTNGNLMHEIAQDLEQPLLLPPPENGREM